MRYVGRTMNESDAFALTHNARAMAFLWTERVRKSFPDMEKETDPLTHQRYESKLYCMKEKANEWRKKANMSLI